MIKLIEYKSETISRGCVFRFPSFWPYEKTVDLLVVSMPDEDSEHALVVSTGHKAGLILVRLPRECESTSCRSIKYQWILDNWDKWIYPECSVEDVFIFQHYDEPEYPIK
ncbi:Imm45 family immunity protein [Scandinavium sp. H11S7]|uniref:Imm45 family immunity protein n=1 Tax=Scandinavium hiltneri TaxID=2926519 RepID=A0ABT2E034_9ENTR|nr:Imm45 family immunity protein [Scandinavium hiltneri]MCS2161241.1 Imm45 family immunity protein [Scandinavium hiltneri]